MTGYKTPSHIGSGSGRVRRRLRAAGARAAAHTALAVSLAVMGLCSLPAYAQKQGFRLDRYEPTTAGSWLFAVDRPWYSPMRLLAVGVTLGYAHDSLRFADESGAEPVVAHALSGSLDIAGAPASWLLLRGSLPVAFLERGTPDAASGVSPLRGFTVGDPRVGVMFRLWGQAERDRISVHLGLDGWLPSGGAAQQPGDAHGRGMLPRVVLAGAFLTRWRWTRETGFLYRADAIIGTPGRGIVGGSEVQLGLAIGLLTLAERLHLGAELRASTRVTAASLGDSDRARLEALLSGQILLGEQVLLGAAVGTGTFAVAGTPDLRALLRLAWAPRRRLTDHALALPDTDGDGIPDAQDRCPYESEDINGVRDGDGCPESPASIATAKAMVFHSAHGGRAGDRDGDGIPDDQDFCPLAPEDHDGFEDEDGCPEPDNDGDGIPDEKDRCPLEAETQNGVDDGDGCPDDTRRVRMSATQIELNEQVQFHPSEARIHPASYPLLHEIGQTLRTHPELKIEVQGHTDDVGNPAANLRLSQQRAESVRAALIHQGIMPSRLAAKGYGSTRPRAPNTTRVGRSQNRRVELWIIKGRK